MQRLVILTAEEFEKIKIELIHIKLSVNNALDFQPYNETLAKGALEDAATGVEKIEKILCPSGSITKA